MDNLQATRWYFAENRKKQGPISYSELKDLLTSGRLRSTDMVLQYGASQWVVLSSIFPATIAPPSLTGPPGFAMPPAPAELPVGTVNRLQNLFAGLRWIACWLLSEVRETVVAFFSQIRRSFSLARTWMRGRRQQAISAKARLSLGEAIYRAGLADSSTKSKLAELESQVIVVQKAKGSTRAIRREQHRHLDELAVAALKQTSAAAEIHAEWLRAKEADATLIGLQELASQQRAALLPGEPAAWRRVAIGLAGTLLLAVGAVFLLPDMLSGGRENSESRQQNFASRAAKSLLGTEALVWTLEGKGLQDALNVLGSAEAKKLVGVEGADGAALADREAILRKLLRSSRSPDVLADARAFIEKVNEPSRNLLAQAASRLGMRPEDLVLEWLTYEAALDLGMMTRIWNEKSNFKGNAAAIVSSLFGSASSPPTIAQGVQLTESSDERIVVNLFGAKIVEETVANSAKEMNHQIVLHWKSNYNYLRDVLNGKEPQAVIKEMISKEGDVYRIDFKDVFDEYLTLGHSQPWASQLYDDSPLVVAARAKEKRVHAEVGKSGKTPSRKALKSLFARLSSSVPLITTGFGSGSGFLVDSNGRQLVITNRHVITNASQGVSVHFLRSKSDGSEEKLTILPSEVGVVSIHRDTDLAVLDISKAATRFAAWKLQPLKLAKKDFAPEPGEYVFAIGHPGESDKILTQTLSDGIISAARLWGTASVIQITAPINPGNSGGPLFNEDGEVIGVNTFIIRKSQSRDLSLEALNFATQSKHVHELLEDKSKSLDDREIAAVVRSSPLPTSPQNAFLTKIDNTAKAWMDSGYQFYDTDLKRSLKLGTVAASGAADFTIYCLRGRLYGFAVLSIPAADVDLAVLNEAGNVVASKLGPNADPGLVFQPVADGFYTVVVSNPTLAAQVIVIPVFRK